MSRTDVHAPYWVKERDPAWRGQMSEHHDHSTGPCDLPDYLATRDAKTRCRIQFRFAGRNFSCGCRMCTNHHGRRADRKRQRAEGKRQARQHDR